MTRSLQPQSPAVLIATLGTEAQVVTASLDLLRRSGEPVAEACVLHTAGVEPAIRSAIERLQTAFAEPPYAGKIPLRLLPILDEHGRPLKDVDTPTSAQAAFRFLYGQVHRFKLEGRRIHLCIAGGRKPLALFGMAAAQMLCDENDALWYLVSGGDFLAGKRLHPQPGEEVQLLRVPFIRWSRVSPVWAGLESVDDPYEAARRIEASQLAERLEAARTFALGALTAGERRVVELLVGEGLSDVQLAERLVLSPRTVEQHLRSVYRKAADHWELEDVGRAQLVALLSLYFQSARLESMAEK